MRKLFLLLSLVFLASACGDKTEEEEKKDTVGTTALQYYNCLIKGDYETFVDGTYHAHPIRKAYRDGLIENAKMYVGQQQREHKGITSVGIDSTSVDKKNSTAEVFLLLNYGDSTKEQILVPMIEVEGIWYMK